jgi:hypothetical protein
MHGLFLKANVEQIPSYGDSRTLAFCAFFGGKTGTNDHCPSKVFLDEPLPANLFVVPACFECNNGFSADEEYLACLISCVIAGTTEPQDLGREKIRRILNFKPALKTRIEQSKSMSDGAAMFMPEWKRVRSVLLKLAKGHALYELHESCSEDPEHCVVLPLILMNDEQRNDFENPDTSSIWPEVGSRAMQRLVSGKDMSPSGWIVVQQGRYRYKASIVEGIDIRIVINEYLAAHICWEK